LRERRKRKNRKKRRGGNFGKKMRTEERAEYERKLGKGAS
jgi:hypothetical protein